MSLCRPQADGHPDEESDARDPISASTCSIGRAPSSGLKLARHIAVIERDLARDSKKALNRTYEIQGMRAALGTAPDDHAIESAGSPYKNASWI